MKDQSTGPAVERADLDQVDGGTVATRRASMTTAAGDVRRPPINGVQCRLTRPVSHQHGHLTEILRTDWNLLDAPLVQVNLTTTFPGRVRAWGLHRTTTDRLFAASGSLCIVCYDGRRSSPTYGTINEFMFGSRNQGLIVIPPGVYHGWKNVGADEASIVSLPTEMYDHDVPDRWELRWDSVEAQAIIPYRWD